MIKKIGIGCGGLFAAFVALVIVVAIVSPSTPTASAQPTVQATAHATATAKPAVPVTTFMVYHRTDPTTAGQPVYVFLQGTQKAVDDMLGVGQADYAVTLGALPNGAAKVCSGSGLTVYVDGYTTSQGTTIASQICSLV